MKTFNYFATHIFAAFLCLGSVSVQADVELDDFIEEASEKNIAEIEAAKLALDKSSNSAVRTFAQKMINDHTKANTELRGVATRKKVELADEATLVTKAKAAIMRQYDGESFDAAYANNQVTAHRDAIEFYKDAAKSTDTEVRTFAVATLPKLQPPLQEAEALVTEIAKNRETIDNKAHRNEE